MRLVVAALAVLLAGGTALFALGRVYGVGPLATGVPPSWLFAAIARSDEATAREIEVLDLAAGERRVFPVDRRVFDMALSSDRRSLFLALQDGAVLELDARNGAPLRELRPSAQGEVRRLLPLPDGRRLAALTGQALESWLSLFDLGSGRETARLELGRRVVGRFVARGDRLLLPAADRGGGDVLLEVTVEPLGVRETALFSGRRDALQLAPPSAAVHGGKLALLSPFALRLALVEGETSREIDLGPLFFAARPTGFQGDLEYSADGEVLHLCLGGNILGERYRVSVREAVASRVGSECGAFARAGDGTLALAVRGKPELRILDARSGDTRRVLPLAGFPVRLRG